METLLKEGHLLCQQQGSSEEDKRLFSFDPAEARQRQQLFGLVLVQVL